MLSASLYPRLYEVEGDIMVSPCPSVHLSVRLWTESCLLCIFNNTCRIHFIFTHLIKQLQNVCKCVACNMVHTSLEKSWNFDLALKSHGIWYWPGKMTFCLEKSWKISESHWKISIWRSWIFFMCDYHVSFDNNLLMSRNEEMSKHFARLAHVFYS